GTTKDRLGYLRALAINSLIKDAASIFMKHEEEILNNEFTVSLMDKSKYQAQIKDIIKISVEKIYRSKEVVEKEIVGYKAINTLLLTYITAVNNRFLGTESNFDKLILQMEPELTKFNHKNLYNRVLSVCNYVAMLSDGQAISKYKIINGEHI
ncbi:MAG: dGTPase, partial [Mangrovimonas sp.]|nr:dGTPase [Mangrovimonas sp.]